MTFNQGKMAATASIFPNDRVENIAAANTPPPPEGEPGSVILLVDHPSLTTLAFHGDLLFKMFGEAWRFGGFILCLTPGEPHSPWEIQRSPFR
jgi:hypothetical protein